MNASAFPARRLAKAAEMLSTVGAEQATPAAQTNAKRTRPTLAAFNAMQAERDEARKQVGEVIAAASAGNNIRIATKVGLDNLYTRILDIEGGIRALRVLSDYQIEHASESREEMSHVEHAQDWILRHLVDEVAHAGETVDEARLGRPTTDRGPVVAAEGGAA